MVRASACHAEGCGFEPRLSRHPSLCIPMKHIGTGATDGRPFHSRAKDALRSTRPKAVGRRRARNYVVLRVFLRSLSRPTKTYVGKTADVSARLAIHNAGGCPSTHRFRPWELVAYIAVCDGNMAAELERYFKSGSGHAFWHKRFLKSPPTEHTR